MLFYDRNSKHNNLLVIYYFIRVSLQLLLQAEYVILAVLLYNDCTNTSQHYFLFAIELSLQHKHGIIIELCSIELSLQQAKCSFNRAILFSHHKRDIR